MFLNPDFDAVRTPRIHEPASNTAAIITLAADANERHVLDFVSWSYDNTPTGGKLSISIAGTDSMVIGITAAGPGYLYLPGMHGAKNEAMVLTLAAGGSGVVGIVNALTR